MFKLTEEQLKNRENFLNESLIIFEKIGKELNKQNGQNLNLTTKKFRNSLKSENIIVLSKFGIYSAYWVQDYNFLINVGDVIDYLTKDCQLISNKFLTMKQYKSEIIPIIKKFKLT